MVTNGQTQVPDRPTGIKATDGTFSDKVRVTFNTAARATVYRVFRCLTTGQTCGTPVGFPKAGDLYYVRARYYDGGTSRFLSRDPISGMGPKTINPYQYALANPLRFVDPSGGVSIRLQIEVTITRRMVHVVRNRLKRHRARADEAAHVARVASNYLSAKLAQPSIDLAAFWAGIVQDDIHTLAVTIRARDAAERASRMALNAERAAKRDAERALSVNRARTVLKALYAFDFRESAKESNLKYLKDILDTARQEANAIAPGRTRAQQDAFDKAASDAEAAFEAAGGIESVVPELAPIVVVT